MRVIEINDPKFGAFDGLIKTTPKKEHLGSVVRGDTTIIINGEVSVIYQILNEEQVKFARHITLNTKPVSTQRTWGIPTQSSVFGTMPRLPLRVDYCRYSAKSKEEKANYKLAFELGKIICEIYKNSLPEEYENAVTQTLGSVHKDWLPVEGLPFTTCNFNINHAIKYHRDTGNVKNTFSNVLILKKEVIGGYLVCPELGITFEQADRALIIFNGQKIVHGVSPVKFLNKGSYRSSVVFYILEQMKHCYPYQQELERVAKRKTIVAKNKSEGINPYKTKHGA